MSRWSGIERPPAAAADPPTARSRVPPWLLVVLAVISTGSWLLIEGRVAGGPHPRYLEMIAAARNAHGAAQIIRAEKERRGLLQPLATDPNRTGLIGPEWSDITTTLGSLAAKRTATNPDLAAVLVRELATLPLRRGDAAVLVLSGSLVGGNVAALAAVQALGLRPVVVSSLGASMWGATDPDFNWLEMEALLLTRQALGAPSILALLGGGGGDGGGMSDDGVARLRASADRHAITVPDPVEDLGALVSLVMSRSLEAAGGVGRVGVFINVGGATVSLGTCEESHLLPTGLIHEPLACSRGTAGLIVRMAEIGVPVVHLLNLRGFALDHGLPVDPIPLPQAGNNPRVYRGASR